MMVLDSKIAALRDHFQIRDPSDWCKLRPIDIREFPNCGPVTLDHVRLYLAGRGLTLKDDGTPEYWQRNIAAARIGGQMGDADTAVVAEFTVLVDSQEKHPWQFKGFRADADRDARPLIIQTEWRSLGPSNGDYTIAGLEDELRVERKSLEDAHGTFLSHGERRDRWMATLARLAETKTSAVIIEATFGQVVSSVQPRGKRSHGTLMKTIHRQVLAWQDDLRVPFVFCDDRRLAEASALALMRRAWRHVMEEKKQKQAAPVDAVFDFLS